VLTTGGDMSQYVNNPIMLWMHLRATGNSKDQILPLGRCVDIKIEGDQITCYLEFDETDPFAMQIYNKYENGTLNMLSLGAKPIEISNDPELMLPGQLGPTVTKWLWVETSCVDIGGNPDAFGCQLYDADDNKIEMASLTPEGMIALYDNLQNTIKSDMKIITLNAASASAILLHLKLNETATEVDVQKAVADLVQLSLDRETQIQTLITEKESLTAAKTKAEQDLANSIKLATTNKIIALVDTAIAEKKILPGQKETYIKLATADFDNTKAALDAITPTKTIAQAVGEGKAAGGDYTALSWNDLDKAGKLTKLKAENFELFKEKFAERFGKEYKG
jgi:hypothetical protein